MTGRDFKPGIDYDWVKNPKKLNPITGFPEGKIITHWTHQTSGIREHHDDRRVILALKARRWR